MCTKKVVCTGLQMIIVISALVMFTAVASAATTYYVDANTGDDPTGDGSAGSPWKTIQHAVDTVAAGDTIIVRAGTYTENVDVNKQLTLQGEGAGVVTVSAETSSDHVFYVTKRDVVISGFTVTGAATTTGILVGGTSGIYLNSVTNCNIHDNTACGNEYGIYLEYSSGNTFTSNTANSNEYCGIYLESSNNNAFTSNTANSNEHFGGIYLDCSDDNTLTSNIANLNAGEEGIHLFDSGGNGLSANIVSENACGIHLDFSIGNDITCNWVHHNDNYGFYLEGVSTGNTIEDNNIISNGVGDNWHYNFYNDQSYDVTAKYNYWGTADSGKIAESIYDYNDNSNKGVVDYSNYRSDPDPCAPIPELPTIILFSVGLLALTGYVLMKRRGNE